MPDTREFKWREKFTEAILKVPDRETQDAAIVAIVRYGALNEWPVLDYPLDMLFEAVREDVDFSIRAYEGGKRGGKTAGRGRPKKEIAPPN